jgi:DMSO/TMAO reductase YedYZ molybdopterin-dependent catalytic subunit/thiosulfate reductase cytochrome b subunit
MVEAIAGLGFPVWIRATHWINVLLIGLVMRAGIQILGSYPRLYWNDHSTPGTEWLKLTRKRIPQERLWISLDQETKVPGWLGQPGGNNLGLGRHWHFFAAIFWVLNGLVYVVLLFVTGEWRRLIPTSWAIVPAAWQTFVTYATLHVPPASAFRPYDPLQQLTYAAVVFLLAPFLILTGAAQSPALEAQVPRFGALFGGRQSARSLHFLGLLAFIAFTVVHTAMVVVTGLGRNMGDIMFGQDQHDQGLAIGIGIGTIVLVALIFAVTSWSSMRWPHQTRRMLGAIIGPLLHATTLRAKSRQRYRPADISPYLIVNGYPPDTDEYRQLAAKEFAGWRLVVRGLVAQPLELSLLDLQTMATQHQITKHHCIQGWSGIAEWAGVPLGAILQRCHPLPQARYLVFSSFQLDQKGRPFYETLDVRLATHPQTILAYEMNDRPLTIPHGAPLRLRVETQLGFKMVKWLRSIEVVGDYRGLGDGQGGSREDIMNYEQAVSI